MIKFNHRINFFNLTINQSYMIFNLWINFIILKVIFNDHFYPKRKQKFIHNCLELIKTCPTQLIHQQSLIEHGKEMKLIFVIALCVLGSTKCENLRKFFDIKSINNNKVDLIDAVEKIFSCKVSQTLRIIGKKELIEMIDGSMKFPTELLTKEIFNKSRILRASYVNVILFENIEDVLTIFHKQNLQYFRLDGFYILVSFDKCNDENEKKIFEIVWKQQIYNINLICKNNSNDEIVMKTFFPYQKNKCGNTNSIIINKFINYSWNNEKFFPSKFKNLHLCQLKVASFLYPPIIMRETYANGTYRYYGSEMEILMGLSFALNFTINHVYYNYFYKGLFFENGTATGILKQVMDSELDMAMGFYFLNFARAKFLSFSQSHYAVSTVIVIPPGKPFSAFEKLFKPFQKIVWICLIMTVSIGILVILFINSKSLQIKNFIYGKSIKSPMLNLFNALLNGNIYKLPKRTFARYLLIVFMIFCFIFRALYQGALYQFLQANGRNPELETIDEMLKEKFTFYVRDTLEYSIKHMSFYNRYELFILQIFYFNFKNIFSTKVVKSDEYSTLIPNTLNPSYKSGVIVPVMEVIYSNLINQKNFTLKILKEHLMDVPIVYYFPKHFHLLDEIDEKMGIYKAAGLVSLWMDKYLDKKYLHIEEPTTGPRVMNLKDLRGGVEMFIFGIILSAIIFVIEKMSFHSSMNFLQKIFKI